MKRVLDPGGNSALSGTACWSLQPLANFKTNSAQTNHSKSPRPPRSSEGGAKVQGPVPNAVVKGSEHGQSKWPARHTLGPRPEKSSAAVLLPSRLPPLLPSPFLQQFSEAPAASLQTARQGTRRRSAPKSAAQGWPGAGPSRSSASSPSSFDVSGGRFAPQSVQGIATLTSLWPLEVRSLKCQPSERPPPPPPPLPPWQHPIPTSKKSKQQLAVPLGHDRRSASVALGPRKGGGLPQPPTKKRHQQSA